MPWIESHTELPRNRKVVALEILLNKKQVEIIGHLHLLWYAILEHQEDGLIAGWSPEYISRCAQWEGNPEQFYKALQTVGLIDSDGKCHNWFNYTSKYLFRKYHTSNPKLYNKIEKLYLGKIGKPKGKPKDDLKVDPQVTPPNLPNHTLQKEETTYTVGFLKFWDAYPKHQRKIGKADSFKKWQILGLEKQTDIVLAGLEKWKKSDMWTSEGGKYINLPVVWLNKKYWLDEPTQSKKASADLYD